MTAATTVAVLSVCPFELAQRWRDPSSVVVQGQRQREEPIEDTFQVLRGVDAVILQAKSR